jgi:hypothetical protein
VRGVPRDLPRSGYLAWVIACALADVEGGKWREVPGGTNALHTAMRHDSRDSTCKAVAACIKYGLMMRCGALTSPHGKLYVNVLVKGCKGCGTGNDGSWNNGTWCPPCFSTQGRSDRSWQAQAVEMACEQMATHGRILPYAIHQRFNVPLYRFLNDDDESIGGSSAIYPLLIKAFPHSPQRDGWIAAIREATGASREYALELRGSSKGRRRAS